jgi:hypothetical protein
MGPFAGMSAPAAVSRPAASQREHFRYRVIFEKRGRERFLSHVETMNVIQRALRRSKLPLHYTEGFHPHPRMSAGPSLAVGMEGFGEFFDVELVEEAAPIPELLNRFLPPGIRVTACAGPFARSDGKLPPEARYTYLLRFDALRALLKSTSAQSERLSESESMWYLLARELGPGLSAFPFECGSPVDPARWFEAEWRRMFERGASLKNEKGKERSCAGCALSLIGEPDADAGGPSISSAGPGAVPGEGGGPSGDAIELVLPGAEGAPRPQDLLMVFVPKNIASLVRIQRLEIRYKCEEDFKDPVEMIDQKLRRT